MTNQCPPFKSVSPLGIFRPWDEPVANAEEDSNLSTPDERKSCTIFSDTPTMENLPSTSAIFDASSSMGARTPQYSCQSQNLKRTEVTQIKKEPETISDSLVSSTSEKNVKSKTHIFEKSHHIKSQKRKMERTEDRTKPKYAKTEVLISPTTAAFASQNPSFLDNFPSSTPSSFFQGLPPSGFSFSPTPSSSSPFLQQSSQFGPLVPLLEPPIFVPAAEMERVCARRPRPKRFSCGECGAAFSNRGQLSGHCRIHTGERPFRCTQPGCGKRFTRNEELTRHRRIHSGLRPFACGVCPKRFGRKDHLKKHLRTHTRHVMPQFPSLSNYEHLQHLQHVQQLQHLHNLHQIQRLHLHMPLIPLPQNGKTL